MQLCIIYCISKNPVFILVLEYFVGQCIGVVKIFQRYKSVGVRGYVYEAVHALACIHVVGMSNRMYIRREMGCLHYSKVI